MPGTELGADGLEPLGVDIGDRHPGSLAGAT
jgi:hypothetical protein